MTSNRRYRRSLSYLEAREELIAGKGTQFDPELVEAFLKVLEDRSRLEAEISEINQIPTEFI